MNKITIVLCEGQDDIAFLSRVLYIQGFEKYNSKLENFINPFNNLFISKIKKTEKFGFSPANYLVPSVVLFKENNYIFLHNLGGDIDSRSSEITKLLDMYNSLKSEEDDFSSYDFEYKFLLFFDADDKGVTKREEEVCELLHKELKHNEISDNYGLYIFNKDGKGTLEDIVLEIMKPNNESIFENAKIFIDSNVLDDERCKEFVCNHREERYKGQSKFYLKKSIISVAGQLQFSAKSNSVIIEKSDFIKKDDLSTNETCKEIIDLFLGDN